MHPTEKAIQSDKQIEDIEQRMRKEMLGVLESFKQELLDAKAKVPEKQHEMNEEPQKNIPVVSQEETHDQKLLQEKLTWFQAYYDRMEEERQKTIENVNKWKEHTSNLIAENKELMFATKKAYEAVIDGKQELAKKEQEFDYTTEVLHEQITNLKNEIVALKDPSAADDVVGLRKQLAWFEEYYKRMEDERSETIKELKDWKDHANRLIEENKNLMLTSEKMEGQLIEKTAELEAISTNTAKIKEKYHKLLDKEDHTTRLKKELNEAKEKALLLESQKEQLKHLHPEKDKAIAQYQKELARRDESLAIIDKQLRLLREENHVVNSANEKLLEKITQLKTIIDKLNGDLSLKDEEIKTVRDLLTSEKAMEHKRLKQKLSEIAKIETKKEVLMSTRIKELMNVVAKQRDVINEFATTDVQLAESFQAVINDTKQKRSAIDYSVVEKEFEEMPIDNAAISRVIDSIGDVSEENLSTEPEPQASGADDELGELIRHGLQNGDPPDVIKRSLIASGKEKATVERVLQLEAEKLNLKV